MGIAERLISHSLSLLAPFPTSAKGGWTKQSVVQQTFSDIPLYPELCKVLDAQGWGHLVPAIEESRVKWEIASSFQDDGGQA